MPFGSLTAIFADQDLFAPGASATVKVTSALAHGLPKRAEISLSLLPLEVEVPSTSPMLQKSGMLSAVVTKLAPVEPWKLNPLSPSMPFSPTGPFGPSDPARPFGP